MSPADLSPFVGIDPLSVIDVLCRDRCRALTAVCFLLWIIGVRCALWAIRWAVGVWTVVCWVGAGVEVDAGQR